MDINKTDIIRLDKIRRINLINSITGIKPVLLVGTRSNQRVTNLGIFSSIVHISSKPALIGFFIRCNKEFRRDTFENIITQKVYTLNHVNASNVKEAHYTSIKFDKNISEFEKCNFTEHYIENFPAPFGKEAGSPKKLIFSPPFLAFWSLASPIIRRSVIDLYKLLVYLVYNTN